MWTSSIYLSVAKLAKSECLKVINTTNDINKANLLIENRADFVLIDECKINIFNISSIKLKTEISIRKSKKVFNLDEIVEVPYFYGVKFRQRQDSCSSLKTKKYYL